MNSQKQSNLQKLLNKISITLESSIKNLTVLELSITHQNYLIVAYIKDNNENIVYLAPSLWPTLDFASLIDTLIYKISRSLAPPLSVVSH